MRVLFDTSVLVPAVVDQLANHEAALDALLGYTDGEHTAYCSTHALAECYATLTALPLRRRILPAEARQLVEESLLERLTAVPLTRNDYVDALRRVAARSPAESSTTACTSAVRRGSRGSDPESHPVDFEACPAGNRVMTP